MCSSPSASTFRYRPSRTASWASTNAVVPLAHAFSTVITGTPVMPSARSTRWATPAGPNTVPTHTASTRVVPASASASVTARWASATRS